LLKNEVINTEVDNKNPTNDKALNKDILTLLETRISVSDKK
tara:strand:+ start:64 stop:186 length:123 start_codon:yes stop_codon:yes gene_type:complete